MALMLRSLPRVSSMRMSVSAAGTAMPIRIRQGTIVHRISALVLWLKLAG